MGSSRRAERTDELIEEELPEQFAAANGRRFPEGDSPQESAQIEAAASSYGEYRGKDSWVNPETGLRAVVYYCETRAGLEALRSMAVHREAKSQESRWYGGYQVVISEVLDSYGDGTIPHPTPTNLYR